MSLGILSFMPDIIYRWAEDKISLEFCVREKLFSVSMLIL